MKKMIYGAIAIIGIAILLLNSSIIADQAVDWVKANPKDPDAPLVLFRAGRWCDIMGNGDRALEIYWKLYEDYPENGPLCAEALYHSAEYKANSSTILAYRKEALKFLDIIANQYASQEEWRTQAKKLYDEVNYAH